MNYFINLDELSPPNLPNLRSQYVYLYFNTIDEVLRNE